MPVTIVSHPLVKHKLGLLRKEDISTKTFRELASEITCLLTYEATKDMPVENKTIQGWAGPVEVESIRGKKITVCTDITGRCRHAQRGHGIDPNRQSHGCRFVS